MDRHTEQRLAALKKWRTVRAEEVSMDPGVLCPNSALEAIAWRAPQRARDLEEVPELKRWFAREFGAEVVAVSRSADEAPESAPA
jgi:ribonuclease D